MKTKLILLGCLLGVMMLPLHAQTFTENFAKEPINQVPSKWSITIGDAAVTVVDDKKSFGLQDNAIVTPKIAGLSNNYLGSEFVIEFDLFFDEAATAYRQFYKLRLWEGKGNFGFDGKHTDPLIIYRHGIRAAGSYKSYNKLKELEINDRVWRHIKLVYSNGGLEVFINDHLLFSNPNLFYQPQMVSIGATLHSSIPLISAFTNFSMIGETEKNLDSECGAMPTEEQLLVLGDPMSLFNKRLEFIKNMSFNQLKGLRTLEYRNDEFMVPMQTRSTTLSADKYLIIPVVAHILRKNDQTGGLTLDELFRSINRANKLLNNYGFHVNLGKVLFINDDDLFNKKLVKGEDKDDNDKIDYKEELDILNRNKSGKLNIYFLPNSYVETKDGLKNTSWANFPSKNTLRQHIIMYNGQTTNETTLTHEIGHWFNLLHTHETGINTDNPNFQNCQFTGDLCCDTPFDPKLSGQVDASCNYIQKSESSISSLINPDPSNLMSYSLFKCRDKFSDDQLKRMYNAYLGMEQDRGYAFEINNQIGDNIQSVSLNPGWKAVQHFETAGNAFMLFFNNQTSEIAIYKLNSDGTKGPRVDYKDYRGTMSTAKIFRKGFNRYLMMISYSLGQLGIIKLNTNGTLGTTQSYQIESGWTNSTIKEVGSTAYLALFNSTVGKVATYSLSSHGKLGKKISETRRGIPFSYDIVETMGTTILCYDTQTGKVAFAIIDDEGIFITLDSNSNNIGENWSDFKFAPFRDNDGNTFQNLLILNKTNGQFKQYHCYDNNTIGDLWYDSNLVEGNLPPGFDTVTPYYVFNGNIYQDYVMFSNSTTGKTLVHQLNNK